MDYSKCVIYKIQHKDNNDLLYVGHTTNFTKRKYEHKSRAICETSKEYNRKVYQMIRENGGWDDFNMIVIEEFPCENNRQAEAEEDRIMREMKTTMNTNRASRSRKEYIQQYYEENKEKISKVRSQLILCECGKTVSKRNISIHIKSKFHLNFLNPCINTDPFVSLQPELVAS